MSDLLFAVFLRSYRLLRSVAVRVLPKERINPRAFSNAQLRKYAQLFPGSVVNVSGWDDRDSEGGYYRDYFPKKTTYAVTNMGIADKGMGSLAGTDVEEFELDLTEPPAPALTQAFDVVFNHTTLEHVFEIDAAFANLCAMSRDVVILVVPVLQQVHIARSFGDYWRPTTLSIAKLFRKNGFEPLIIKTNDQPFMAVYCFAIGVRDPKKHADLVPSLDFEMGGAQFGSSLKGRLHEGLLR